MMLNHTTPAGPVLSVRYTQGNLKALTFVTRQKPNSNKMTRGRPRKSAGEATDESDIVSAITSSKSRPGRIPMARHATVPPFTLWILALFAHLICGGFSQIHTRDTAPGSFL